MRNLEQILASLDESAQKVLILGGAKHPVWDDANEVFALAMRQILDKSLGGGKKARITAGRLNFMVPRRLHLSACIRASCEEA